MARGNRNKRTLAGFLRGLVQGLLLGGVTGAIEAATDAPKAEDPKLAYIFGAIVLALRTLEGVVDQWKKGDENEGRNKVGL